jgi:hypothetical protein
MRGEGPRGFRGEAFKRERPALEVLGRPCIVRMVEKEWSKDASAFFVALEFVSSNLFALLNQYRD